jgi:hypothetical protein
MRIRAGVAPAAARLESSRYGPDCDFACAISDPERHLSPVVMSGSGLCGGSAITRTGSIGAARHPMAGQRGAPTGRGPLGLRLGLCALPWRVAAHVVGPALRQEVGELQEVPAMARPGLEPGTPRFSGSRSRRWSGAKCLRIDVLWRVAALFDTRALAQFRAGLGLRWAHEVPIDRVGRHPREAPARSPQSWQTYASLATVIRTRRRHPRASRAASRAAPPRAPRGSSRARLSRGPRCRERGRPA